VFGRRRTRKGGEEKKKNEKTRKTRGECWIQFTCSKRWEMRRIVGRFCGPFLQFYVAQRVAVVVVMVVIVTGGAKRRRGRRRMAVKMKKMKKMKKKERFVGNRLN
jgi:uncharacterized membrane protein